jgi:cytochrome c oxidase subunit II
MNREFRLMPEQASTFAPQVDALYTFLVLVSGFFSILIAGLIVYFAVKYRRGSPADRTHGSSHFFLMELTWIVIPFVISMVMFFWGARLYFDQMRAPAGAMEIDCVGKQWMWKFQHPNGNAEINDLHVPVGQPIRLRMISEDVIHSMFIPAFRTKLDVLPGRYTTVWFEATKPGEYHLFCAEYCGAKHSEMRGTVYVMQPHEYQEWLLSGNTGPTTAESGRLLFEQLRCHSCHQGGGVASRGPPLENLFGSTVPLQDGTTVLADETYIRESILRPQAKVRAGYQPIMPSYDGQISEEGILQLIAEIKALGRGDRRDPPSEVDPAELPGDVNAPDSTEETANPEL